MEFNLIKWPDFCPPPLNAHQLTLKRGSTCFEHQDIKHRFIHQHAHRNGVLSGNTIDQRGLLESVWCALNHQA